MGLAVSQVRLLALTRRKADIELDIQINAKRKQALTRRATELSQQYYQKLQHSNIQYATSDGYEDVNYGYLMGINDGTSYSNAFLSQVLYGNGEIPQKTCNTMILTDQYGEVVVNDSMAKIITKMKAAYGDKKTEEQAAYAIKQLISEKSGANGFSTLDDLFSKLDSQSNDRDPELPNLPIDIMMKMMKNGGYMDGGTVYQTTNANGDTIYVASADLAQNVDKITPHDEIQLQDGYNYNVYTPQGAIANVKTAGCMYDAATGSFIENTNKKMMQYLGNVVSYFAPIITAALNNGITSDVSITGLKTSDGGNYPINIQDVNQGETPEEAAARLLTQPNSAIIIRDKDGELHAFERLADNAATAVTPGTQGGTILPGALPATTTGSLIQRISPDRIETNVDKNSKFLEACDTKKLQAGFQSGVFQMCHVYNVEKGSYHKNTTLDYFIHMGYVSEKLDSSEREEITAWYNAEQAKISEQETYWDEEVTNLSTELSSVNTEIDSVKQLKSNAIKSVFDWGSS